MFPEGAVAADEVILLCGLDWCWTPTWCKGYCLKHYNAVLDGRVPFTDDPNRAKATKPTCSFDPCEQLSVALGLCPTHYTQQSQGRELKAIKPRIKHTDPKRPGQRLCGECQQWKETEENFYKSSGGGYQNRCKPCIIKYNAAWAQARKLREKGVDVG